MSNKLPKHIAKMVEKNNLVMAIKTYASEQDISMGEAKEHIDSYEAKLVQKHEENVQIISEKQGVQFLNAKAKTMLDDGLNNHLDKIGYKEPILPYWLKRVAIVSVIILSLSLLIWQLIP